MSEPFLIAQPLLHWFWANHRVLPFRSDPTPYHVWVSEIMLQQTRVAAAVPYYERFVQELPDIPALAACEEERLLKLWEGLGYYSRVRNLQKAARIVCEQYGGQLPGDLAALKKLPGIGDYTAGAIASIGFGIPAPAVDGNVLRVFARLYNDEGDIMQPAVKAATTQKVMAQQPAEAPGDFNQALMELGALVCTPGQPDCAACPLQALCLGCQSGNPARLPQKAPKKARKKCELTLCLAQDAAGRWLLQKRGEQGVLAAARFGRGSAGRKKGAGRRAKAAACCGAAEGKTAEGQAYFYASGMAHDGLCNGGTLHTTPRGLRVGLARAAGAGIHAARRF